jgi:integrase/recombinase XerD
MLVLFRRHERRCSHRSRNYKKCPCPIWLDWRVDGHRVLKTMATRDWAVAQTRAREFEVTGAVLESAPQTIEQAVKKFLGDAAARNLRPSTIDKYKVMFRQLESFVRNQGLIFLSAVDIEKLRVFRESWKTGGIASRKRVEMLRTFFRFCADSGWLRTNPAKLLKPPKVEAPQVLPFSDQEMKKIFAACSSHRDKKRGALIRALALLMYHTGIRIGDAVTLSRDRIHNGILTLRTTKTGASVRIPLHADVLTALKKLPEREFYFWNGESNRVSLVKRWDETFARLFKKAGIVGGHPHRFRHTFAVRALQHNVSMENLAMLLGHKSLRITEKFYSAWALRRQEMLEQEVRRTW